MSPLTELLAHPGVREELTLAGPVGVMALHGGLEAETDSIAREAAALSGASLYVVTQPSDLAWHLPSIRYRPEVAPRLARFLDHVRRVVSIHGFGRRHLPRTVLVGGSREDRRSEAATVLRRHTTLRVLDDLDQVPNRLRGVHPDNPVNLPPEGGAQLELSAGARREPHRAELVRAVAELACGEFGRAASGTVRAP